MFVKNYLTFFGVTKLMQEIVVDFIVCIEGNPCIEYFFRLLVENERKNIKEDVHCY